MTKCMKFYMQRIGIYQLAGAWYDPLPIISYIFDKKHSRDASQALLYYFSYNFS